MSKKGIFCCILFMLLNWSCHEKDTLFPVLSVNISSELKILNGDSLFDWVEYIPLETTKSNLFSVERKTLVCGDTLYLCDKDQEEIFQYDIEGNYIKKLSARGNGPGEYLSISDFIIEDSLLMVLSSQNRKLYFYTIDDFRFVRAIPLPVNMMRMRYDDGLVYLYSGNFSSELYNMYVLDIATNKIVSRYKNFDKKYAGFFYARKIFNMSDEHNYYFEPYDYHIYEAMPEDDSVVLRLDFGKENMLGESFMKKSPKSRSVYIKEKYSGPQEVPIFSIDDLYYSDSLLFFTFVHGVMPYWYIRHGNVTYTGYIVSSERFPLLTPHVLYIDENYIYELVYPETILERVEYCQENRKAHMVAQIPEWLIAGIKFDDNPVLCRYKLKK